MNKEQYFKDTLSLLKTTMERIEDFQNRDIYAFAKRENKFLNQALRDVTNFHIILSHFYSFIKKGVEVPALYLVDGLIGRFEHVNNACNYANTIIDDCEKEFHIFEEEEIEG